MINNKISPVSDKDIEDFFKKKKLKYNMNNIFFFTGVFKRRESIIR